MKAAVICGQSIGLAFVRALMRNGFGIVSICSAEPAIVQFANQHGIAVFNQPDQFYSNLREARIDFLFSIINPRIVPGWVLSIPKLMALNFHDSLLPKHGGVNATFWAIWQGDAEVGYTWHQMTDRVDAGPVVFQSRIALSGAETTYVANLKILKRATEEFDAFLERCRGLANGRFKPVPAFRLESYHRPQDKPAAHECILDPRVHSADEIRRKIRASDVGPFKPPFVIFDRVFYENPSSRLK